MSPNDPLPIFLTSLYFPLTRNSDFVDNEDDTELVIFLQFRRKLIKLIWLAKFFARKTINEWKCWNAENNKHSVRHLAPVTMLPTVVLETHKTFDENSMRILGSASELSTFNILVPELVLSLPYVWQQFIQSASQTHIGIDANFDERVGATVATPVTPQYLPYVASQREGSNLEA